MRHAFRSDTDPKEERARVRDAYPELWRLLTRRPARSAPWRDYWKAFLPAMTMLFVLNVLWGPPGSFLSFEWIATIVVASVLVIALTLWLFRRLGLIGNHPA